MLAALLVREHHEFDPLRFIAATPETEQGYGASLGSQLSEPRVLFLVADRGGVVLGYTYAGLEDTDYMALRGPAGAPQWGAGRAFARRGFPNTLGCAGKMVKAAAIWRLP